MVTKFKFKWPEKTYLSKGAFFIVKKLRRAGFEAFLAGGAVRDAILKRPIEEIDIATSAKPEQVEKLFKKTFPTGKKHGTITVYPFFTSPLSRGRKRGYEVTTFRQEGPYRKHRWPTKVRFLKSAEEDAKRRDFTINALFYDPDKKVIIDYVNAIADIAHRRIRFIGESEDRIREDALRMLRAVRFATTLQFYLARETHKAIKKNSKLIQKISAERIKQEIDRIMNSKRPALGIGLLDIVGLLQYILPEVKNLQGVEQPKNQHAEGDVYTHTLLSLEKVDETYDLATRYALLFHDLGKPQTKEIVKGKITFYKHQNVGAEMTLGICRRLRFSLAEMDKIVWLSKNHLVPNDLAVMKLSTQRKWGLNPYFKDLLKLFLADAKASIPGNKRKKPNLKPYHLGLKILEDIRTKSTLKKPLLSGLDVMKILKIKEGPAVGKVLKILEEKKLAGEIRTRSEAKRFLQKIKNYLKNFTICT